MIRRLFDSEMRRFILFLAVGAVNTGFGLAVFAVLLRAGCARDIAVVLSTIAGVAFNFRTIGSVFAARGLSRLPHYIAAYGVLMFANIALLRMLVAAGCGAYLGEAVVAVAIAPLSFFIMRWFVFVPATEHVS